MALDHLPPAVCKRVLMDVAAVARRSRTENFPVASTVFATHFKTLLGLGRPRLDALAHAYGYGFWALAFFGAAAIIAALTLIRREEMAETPATAPIG